jgi:hypothetical protein
MHNTDFLTALHNAMPTHTELEEYGLDAHEIDEIQASFRFVTRKPSETSSIEKSELERLLLENDCSTVEVGLIRFLKEPREHRYGVQVAFCEADPIVVGPSGAVAMHDHANPDKSMSCAADSERFLDALGAFLTVRREKSKWKGRAKEAADLCSEQAGGRDYTPFFQLLCGYLT